MKKLILLLPVLPVCALALSSCTTVVKEPATATTTTHSETVERTPTTTSTTVTHQAGGY